MEFLITLTIKSTLLIFLSGLLLLALRKNSATLRHWILSLTMIGLLGLPLFIQLLPTVQVEVPFAPSPLMHMTKTKPKIAKEPKIERHPYSVISNEKTISSVGPIALKKVESVADNNNIITNSPAPKKTIEASIKVVPSPVPNISLPMMIGIIWLLGCCYFFIRFLLGIFHVWSVTRNSTPFTIPPNLPAFMGSNIHQNVQFLVSPTIQTPMTWGAFRPVVLLPIAAYDWKGSELNTVLVHELHHIERKDYWIHTLGLLSVCLYWYNPLMWWMKKQQILEREKACDEAVLRSGVQRQHYADQLLQITRYLKRPSSMIGENALPMAKVSQLKKRVIAILNFEEQNYQFSSWRQWQWGAFYGALFPFLAVLHPIGQQVLQEYFPLPPLETIAPYLETKQVAPTIVSRIFSKKKETFQVDRQLAQDTITTAVHINQPKHKKEHFFTRSLEMLPVSLTIERVTPVIEIEIPSTVSQDSLPTEKQGTRDNISLQQQIQTRLVNLHQVSNADENFDGYEGLKTAIGAAEIVMLGEQAHREGTTFETKIKLIKYLHQEMGFDIVAFESNLYEVERAWSMIEKGHTVKETLGKSIFTVWSALEEFNPLYEYVEKQKDSTRPLRVTGFDHQMTGKIGVDYFVADLKSYMNTITDASLYQDQFQELQTFLSLVRYGKIKGYNKKRASASIHFLKELQGKINAQPVDEQSALWLQSIQSLHLFISDMKLGTDHREEQMAQNLIWLKEKYPNKKIICWGATSHFLYNSAQVRTKSKVAQALAANYYKKQRMMGDYLKEKYGDKIFTIGFTAYEGINGYSLKLPPPNSVEYLIGKAKADNYFLPLKGLSLEGYLSRPLGNYYMTNDIAQVMDGVIFNREMKPCFMDWDFFMYLVPENKYIPKKIDRLKRYQAKRRSKEYN